MNAVWFLGEDKLTSIAYYIGVHVPEPAGLFLVGLGLVLVFRLRRMIQKNRI